MRRALLLIAQVSALFGNMVGDEFRIVPDAPDEGRAAARDCQEAEEVDPGSVETPRRRGRAVVCVEGGDVEPAEVEPEAGGPDDGRDAGGGEVEAADGSVTQAGSGAEDKGPGSSGRSRLLRATKASASASRPRRLASPAAMFFLRSSAKLEPAVGEGLGAADQVMPAAARSRKSTVKPPPAPETAMVVCSTPGVVSVSQRLEHAEPPDEIAAAVAARRAVVGADREPGLAPAAAISWRSAAPRRLAPTTSTPPAGRASGFL
ncbi:MAG: hypothetical protein R3D59_10630 [Paracoccaceae bacterium]